MIATAFPHPLLGGALIGLAATLLLLCNGRVAGVSGILAGSLGDTARDGFWRWSFLFGMIAAGAAVGLARPELFANLSGRSPALVAVAGLLVGYGTVMGGGCTSGHGICGLSRRSPRSLVATAVFMACGFLAVGIVRRLGGAS